MTSGTVVMRLVYELHKDASCLFRMPDTPPFLKDKKIQALIAYQISISGSEVLLLTVAELRFLATTYGDTASEISVRDFASQFSQDGQQSNHYAVRLTRPALCT